MFSPTHEALPSSSPAAFSYLENTPATPNDRPLSENGSGHLDLLCASKVCSPPSIVFETFNAARFEADIVSHSNDFSKGPSECVYFKDCVPIISSSSLPLVTLSDCSIG